MKVTLREVDPSLANTEERRERARIVMQSMSSHIPGIILREIGPLLISMEVPDFVEPDEVAKAVHILTKNLTQDHGKGKVVAFFLGLPDFFQPLVISSKFGILPATKKLA
jgi:hypothetical protein